MESDSTVHVIHSPLSAGCGEAALGCFPQTCGSNPFYMGPTPTIKCVLAHLRSYVLLDKHFQRRKKPRIG